MHSTFIYFLNDKLLEILTEVLPARLGPRFTEYTTKNLFNKGKHLVYGLISLEPRKAELYFMITMWTPVIATTDLNITHTS